MRIVPRGILRTNNEGLIYPRTRPEIDLERWMKIDRQALRINFGGAGVQSKAGSEMTLVIECRYLMHTRNFYLDDVPTDHAW